MDFGALPPEINSTRMYAGPGSGPMLATSAAWDALAADLNSAAAAQSSVVATLTGGPWQGAAAVSMATAAAGYVAWLNTTAAQAEQTAGQARAAAAAYETARAMTVPPPLIAANRSQVMSLIATNLLGQNTPAIAATEALYGQMWAQDAAAMYGYAGTCATASTLTPFTGPQPATNPAGPSGQTAALAQVTATSVATNTQTTLSQAMTAVPTTLQGLASPLSSDTATSSSLSSLSSALSPLTTGLSMTSSAGWISSALLSNANQLKSLLPAAGAAATTASGSGVTGLAGGLGSGALTGVAGPGGAPSSAAVSAGLGGADSIGALSVPPAWAAPTTALHPAPAPTGASLPAAMPDTADGPGLLGAAPLAGMPGRTADPAATRPAFRLQAPTVIPHSPAAG